MAKERLQKFLAHAGVASRRHAETLMIEGRVAVNGKVITEMGFQVDASRDHIKVDGKRVGGFRGAPVYYVMNKPRNFVVTKKDPEGRPTVFDLLKRVPKNVINIGRLDFDTEGLLLFSNDGDLTFKLTHPRFAVPRTYVAKVSGHPDQKSLLKMARGMVIEGVRLKPSRVRLIRKGPQNAWLEIVVTEGKNRQIRQMCLYVGYPVQKLRRTSYGAVKLGTLPLGGVRQLNEREIKALKDLVSNPNP